jgi:glycosyltransferase involved in cell wall biosynthesis
MNDIKVSVVTCLYNTTPKLFKQCLTSIYNQTFKDFEVLILNDGSTKYLDENIEIIKSFNDNRFKYFDTEHTGKSQTLNYAFKIANGNYIAICDSDDQMLPERLQYQYEFLESNDYDVISNAMMTDDNHIIFPQVCNSHEVQEYEVHVSVMHPSYMLNKQNVLNKVPFLFSQIYDSMEDAVFNQIMYHYGVKMWYDENVLQIYSHQNENSVHFENVNDKFKKDCTFKLNNRTFNYNHTTNSYTTVILLVNNKWGVDIEKTVLNIRMTCNNVKIFIADYSNKKMDLSYLNKYNVEFIKLNDNENTYSYALLNSINKCNSRYCFIISKPIRFYTQDWDLIYERYLETYPYTIVQPYLIGIDKIDDNYYVNENGKQLNKDIKCGMQLSLFDKQISYDLTELYFYSEYLVDTDIPSINNDLIFFCNTENIKKIINGVSLFNLSTYIALYISISFTLNYGSVKINKDVKCGYINDDFIIEKISKDEYNILYYYNMILLIWFFCNESKYIYEKIIYDSIGNKKAAIEIINNLINNIKDLQQVKNSIKLPYDISWFLKKNNLNKEWILTTNAY